MTEPTVQPFIGFAGAVVEPITRREIDDGIDFQYDAWGEHYWAQADEHASELIGRLMSLLRDGAPLPYDLNRVVAEFGPAEGEVQRQYAQHLCGVLTGRAFELRDLHAMIGETAWYERTALVDVPWSGIPYEHVFVLAEQLDELGRALAESAGIDQPTASDNLDEPRRQQLRDRSVAAQLAVLIDRYAAREVLPPSLSMGIGADRESQRDTLVQRISAVQAEQPHVLGLLSDDRREIVQDVVRSGGPQRDMRRSSRPAAASELDFARFQRTARILLARLLHPKSALDASRVDPAALLRSEPVQELTATHRSRPDYTAALMPVLAGLVRHLAVATSAERDVPAGGRSAGVTTSADRGPSGMGLSRPGTPGACHSGSATHLDAGRSRH
jgi:hypothetical protein